MPRDLFGDVSRPSISLGSRKWYTLPLSLFSHSAIVLALVAIPILAPAVMPSVFADAEIDYMPTVLPPPPPPPAIRKLDVVKPIENPNAAPLEPPDGIRPEPIDRDPVVDTVPGIVGGSIDGTAELVAPPPPPEEKAPPVPVRPGFQGVRNPVKTHHVDPVYPQFAIISRTQGVVIVEATIGEDGRVINARILRSVALLDQAALDAVRQWQFTPTQLNGKPVPVIMTVTVNFTLSR
jgi:periplasmic protein TonB